MLDKNGFQRPTYDELVEQLSDKWKELFGDNANTESNSVGGIFIRVIGFFQNQLYLLAESVYNSQFLDSASGNTLDQLAGNAGYTRHAAQAGIGKVRIYGDANYLVPEGTIFKTNDELEYVTSSSIRLKDTGNTTITLGDNQTITANDGKTIGIGESDLLYANGEGAKYNKPDELGSYVVLQVTPVSEIQLVQIGEVSGGADIESDEDLRDRLEKANQEAPSSPYNGVISSVRNVNGVKSVKLVVNDTMETDSAGNPPKTIHIYVDGGEQLDVANAILDSVAAGVQTYGGTQIGVPDIAGVVHPIFFDKPALVDVYAKIELEINDDFPTDGLETIKQNVVDYINGIGMGGTVYFSYIFRNIYDNVPGIEVAKVAIGTDKDKLSMADIELTDIQRANATVDFVEVSNDQS